MIILLLIDSVIKVLFQLEICFPERIFFFNILEPEVLRVPFEDLEENGLESTGLYITGFIRIQYYPDLCIKYII